MVGHRVVLLLLLMVLVAAMLLLADIQFWFLRHGDFVWKICRDV